MKFPLILLSALLIILLTLGAASAVDSINDVSDDNLYVISIADGDFESNIDDDSINDDSDEFEDDSDDWSDVDDDFDYEYLKDYHFSIGMGSASRPVPSVYIPKYVDYPFAYAASSSVASNSYSGASSDASSDSDVSDDVNQSNDQNDFDEGSDSLSSNSSKDINANEEQSKSKLSTNVDINHKAGNPLLILVISLLSLLFVPINKK